MKNILFSVFILIGVLDGREINELTRQFLINWKASKEAKKKKNNKHILTVPPIPYPLSSKALNYVLLKNLLQQLCPHNHTYSFLIIF